MWKRVVGGVVLVVLVLAGGVFAYLYFRSPESAPPSNIKVDMSEARIARGKYVYNLADCDGCHTLHDPKRLDSPAIESTQGQGQVFPDADMPGTIVVRNITPDPETGVGNWTDGEKIRAIREGISRDGHMLFPLMPYPNYRHMSDDDVQALVAYLNTLKPIRNPLPPTQVKFPVSMFVKGVPQPVREPVRAPERSNQVIYGEYLVTLASCETCHTPFEKGQLDLSKRFAGGRKFTPSGFKVVTANITPDMDTGIGKWSPEQFKERFYKHREYEAQGLPEVGPERFTLMPWLNLSKLPPEDLEAIYAYLRTQRPIENKVVTHPDAPPDKQ